MSVKFFGQFLIDQGEIDASDVREALTLMDSENRTLGAWAIEQGYMQQSQVAKVNAEQRRNDAPFGDLAVSMGLMNSDQLVDVLQRQRESRIPIGEALIRLGHLRADRLGVLLDEYKADQSQYDVGEVELPDGLASHRVSRYVIDLLPRFMMRVAKIQVKVGEIESFKAAPEFADICVSVPIKDTRGLDVALVSDLVFAERLAVEASGLSLADLDPEMVADGVGEFLNVLTGNAASAVSKEGYPVELGPPDYDAELCDGWVIDLAVGEGRAALVLSTF
ncbi:MAG: chemotaxis protein CheX [Myxococcota bacterium]